MADNQAPFDLPDAEQLTAAISGIADRSQKLVQQFIEKQPDIDSPSTADPLNIASAFLAMTQKMLENPAKMAEAQIALWSSYVDLWQSTTAKMMGIEAQAVATPERGDKRFKDEEWEQNPLFDYIKQSYLLTARWMQGTVNEVEGLDPKTAQKVDFYTRQFADALSPSNFAHTNPEVIRATVESNGENLLTGLSNLLDDMNDGNGQLKIKMTDPDAFEVGGNIATTPGQVVYQNELMQLIQYTPTTEKSYKRPLLIIPPWINKFYILDLKPSNSFIKWAVDQGQTVFVISWVNPDAELAEKSFANYVQEGPLAALDAIEKATGERQVNAIGYCIGGTLLATTLAYMAAKQDDRIKSATFFTTMVDFEEPGELGVFVDEEQLKVLDDRMQRDGVLDGSAMATTFNMLRSNDLIWSFVVNNYLMGKDPFPFDLLYWNSDSTRMPRATHSFYLRNMYLENKLVEPGGIEIDGVAIDVTKIKTPIFILSTKEDHIAPWKSTFAATRLYSGPVKFCLAGSGHIAGVVNPPNPDKVKYGYWLNSRKVADPDKWYDSATHTDGSWWPEWQKWVARHGGGKVEARVPGDGALKVIEAAPGSYVKA